jgi:prepilin peptidase CpaA
MAHAIIYTVLVVVLAAAVYTDVRWGRIRNWTTVPGVIAGIVLNTAFFGLSGLVLSLEGAALALGVFLALSIVGRIIGAGDAKLLMAVGALIGPTLLGWSMIYGALVGGFLAVVLALSRCRLRQELASMGNSLVLRLFAGYRMDLGSSPSLRLPYAVPLALGVLASVILRGGVKVL